MTANSRRSENSLQSCASANFQRGDFTGKNSAEIYDALIYMRNRLRQRGYALGKVLGTGSFATVRKARSVATNQKFAIKIVDCSKAPEDFTQHFFPRELAIIRKLKHHNIIEVVEVLKVDWSTCIVMERASGGDILDYLMKHGPMADDIACHVFRQAMQGLKYCHDKNIAHRDLKCENVLLTHDNRVKLADFGFARYTVNKEDMRALSETYCGSAAYAAPEVLQGQPYDPIMSDNWSMGVVLYVMVCAVMPFDDSSYKKMLADQKSKRWTFSKDRRKHIAPNCRKVVRHLLEPDIDQRATMRQVLASPWLRVDGGKDGDFLRTLALTAAGTTEE